MKKDDGEKSREKSRKKTQDHQGNEDKEEGKNLTERRDKILRTEMSKCDNV